MCLSVKREKVTSGVDRRKSLLVVLPASVPDAEGVL